MTAKRIGEALAASSAVVCLVAVAWCAILGCVAAQEARRPGLVKQPEGVVKDAPDESKVYVWPTPQVGRQSLLILGVLDDGSVDAAYLTPINLKVQSKLKVDDLEKLLAGKLLVAELQGKDGASIKADLWLGKDSGWLSKKK